MLLNSSGVEMEYSEEPRLVFSPLTDEDYCLFYNLEMANYTEDASFYKSFLNTTDTVLELGCGNGRLTRLLAPSCQAITGIDLSQHMIDLAEKSPRSNISYSCMDMMDFQFVASFDTIIIPYNTLNLLGDKQSVEKCLYLCKEQLKDNGKLLLHLYHPNHKILNSAGEKTFQFNILEQDNCSKVIKETLKSYCNKTATLTLEERYRVRPIHPDKANRDLNHLLNLYSPILPRWDELLQSSGFSVENHWGNFNFSPFDDTNDTILLIHANTT